MASTPTPLFRSLDADAPINLGIIRRYVDAALPEAWPERPESADALEWAALAYVVSDFIDDADWKDLGSGRPVPGGKILKATPALEKRVTVDQSEPLTAQHIYTAHLKPGYDNSKPLTSKALIPYTDHIVKILNLDRSYFYFCLYTTIDEHLLPDGADTAALRERHQESADPFSGLTRRGTPRVNRKENETETAKLQGLVSADLKSAFEAEASRRGLTKSRALEEAVRLYLGQDEGSAPEEP